jgi:hypothetical protein
MQMFKYVDGMMKAVNPNLPNTKRNQDQVVILCQVSGCAQVGYSIAVQKCSWPAIAVTCQGAGSVNGAEVSGQGALP